MLHWQQWQPPASAPVGDKRKKVESKYDPKDLFLDGYDYRLWPENEEESIDKEECEGLPLMPLSESDEEVKEGEGIKI